VKAYDRHMTLVLEDMKEMWTELSKRAERIEKELTRGEQNRVLL